MSLLGEGSVAQRHFTPLGTSPIIIRSENLQNESFPNFSNFCPKFCPEFCSEFSPNFLRSFRASFRGKLRPEKNHRKSPALFNAKSPGKPEAKIHKSFLGGGQSKSSRAGKGLAECLGGDMREGRGSLAEFFRFRLKLLIKPCEIASGHLQIENHYYSDILFPYRSPSP